MNEEVWKDLAEQFPEQAEKDYPDSTYMVVSRVAYLIGVPKHIFENEHEAPKMDVYNELDKNKNARIIRNLCMLRTALEANFSKIQQRITYDIQNLHTMPDLIPQECLTQLRADGIEIIRANQKPAQYLLDINGHINNKIGNCKPLLPIWLNWDYIKPLFIMPNGTKEAALKAAAAEYYQHRSKLPYQVYMNWPGSYQGNILYSDKKFVTLLYEAHEDCFWDMSKVTDAGQRTKNDIYDFLEDSERVEIVVDCENSDAYKFCATLKNLDQQELLDHVAKIVLYDDIHTPMAWEFLSDYSQIPVERIELERVKEDKSYLDVRLTAGVCKDYYRDGIDAFILVSSDSDYWGLIDGLQDARYLVMVEEGKVSGAIREKLRNSGISYCYIDDFYTGNVSEFKTQAVLAEVRRKLDGMFCLNVRDMMDEAFTNTRADLSEAERRQLYDRYIKPMRIVIEPDGSAHIKLGE